MKKSVTLGSVREGQTFAGRSLASRYASFVKLPHTLFALPFAGVGALLASYQYADRIDAQLIVWIVLAFTSARFAAMGFNRIVDRHHDAQNPRTQLRELPAGRLTLTQAWVAVSFASLLFVFASFALSVHVLANHKHVGNVLVLVLVAGPLALAELLGIEHPLLILGYEPSWRHSPISGFGPYLGPVLWFELYWVAWTVLLALVARLFWVRGLEQGLRERVRSLFNAKERGVGSVQEYLSRKSTDRRVA